MTEDSELDGALEQVVTAARAHLAAVKAAGGALENAEVWRTYVALNNASHAYDQLLLDRYGEVTPWETEEIDLSAAQANAGLYAAGLGEADDPYPTVISVRQRRDYRVPSVSALLRVAQETARRARADEGDDVELPSTVGEAVLELVQAGDGSLSALDVPELEPLEGVVTVTEVAEPLDLESLADDDEADPFQTGPDDQLVGRLDEHPLDLEEDETAIRPGSGSIG